LADAGYGDRLLLGGDTITARARASTGEGLGIPYLLEGLRPRLIRRLGEEFVPALFVANPARAFAADWRD
jgi:phosphotriesterase-related protein